LKVKFSDKEVGRKKGADGYKLEAGLMRRGVGHENL
jgi:hypothetical protein